MKISNDFFTLTKEQKDMSEMMYDGKIIKCLVAPYHSYAQLEKEIPFTKTTYLFPEREMSLLQIRGLISTIVANKSTDEFRIVTANQNIIIDMIDDCVRVLTEEGEIVPSPCKTFMANIHTIRYELLENEEHQISKKVKEVMKDRINKIIDLINGPKKIDDKTFKKIEKEIETIGEPLIGNRLKDMLNDKRRGSR